jgi:hypothetical protein
MDRRVFTSKNILPSVYNIMLSNKFGEQWKTWELETLWVEIEQEWGSSPTGEVRTKIGALRAFLDTDMYWNDAGVFENIVLAMNDHLVTPDTLQLASPVEIYYAMRVLNPIKQGKFTRPVIGYIRVAFEKAGILKFPELLRFAEPWYEGELATIYDSIVAKDYGDDLDETSAVALQSQKIFDLHLQVASHIGAMRSDIFESSTE